MSEDQQKEEKNVIQNNLLQGEKIGEVITLSPRCCFSLK
jgi:hypothetical protein